MCRDQKTLSMTTHQHGFAIVAAIFLLTVLAALGAFMLTFSNAQQLTSAQDLQGAKAYQAARTGIEWGAYQALHGSCAGSAAITVGGWLAGLAVTVQCVSYGPYTEGGNTISIYDITSTATQGAGGTLGAIERQLKVTVAK